MANDLQIKMRIDVVKERMLDLIKEVLKQQMTGAVKTESELHHLVYQSLQSFYASIGKETFKQIEAWGPPYSQDHNGMMEQAAYDLFNLYQEIGRMTADLESNFQQVEIERQAFLKRISEIEGTAQAIESNLKRDFDILIFRDDFSNTELFDKDAVGGVRAYLASNEQLLTLNRRTSEEYNEDAVITIISGNGLPGNTHIVRSSENRLKFDGESNLHINMADILDQNSDTWFEYEMFRIHPKGYEITEGKDYRYKESIEWIDNDIRDLRCVVQIRFPEPKMMNWVSFLPYIPSDRGALPAKIEKMVISDGKGNVNGMGFEEDFDSGKAFIFPQQLCKEVTLYLRQDTSYPIDVGHFCFKEVNSPVLSVGDEPHMHDGIRVHGTMPSIENLGISFDSGTNGILFPIAKIEEKMDNETEKKKALFIPPSISAAGQSVLSGVEAIPAFRYMVGIRDAVLSSYRFSGESDYISNAFTSEKEIRELTISSTEDVPEEFGPGNWIQYSFSIDGGRTWHLIDPESTQRENRKIRYLLNSGAPKDARVEEIGYIEHKEPVHSVRVKIELSRPQDQEFEFSTPIVYGYELNALVE